MNTLWMIVAFFVMLATGKVLFATSGPRPATTKPMPSPKLVERGRDAPRPVAPFPLLSRSDPFDENGNVIWRTQIPALRAVCERDPIAIPCSELRPIYIELTRRYPEIYDGQTFREWGQLFVDLGLLRVLGQSVHVTEAGRALYRLLVQQSDESRFGVATRWTVRLRS